MRKLLVYLSLAALAVAGYYGYRWYQQHQRAQGIWTLIPDDAIGVVEIDDALTQWDLLNGAPAGQRLLGHPQLKSFASDARKVIALAKSEAPGFEKYFVGQQVAFSIHPTEEQQLAALIYLPLNKRQREAASDLLLSWSQDQTMGLTPHQFGGRSGYKSSKGWCILIEQETLVLSPSASLFDHFLQQVDLERETHPLAERKRAFDRSSTSASPVLVYLQFSAMRQALGFSAADKNQSFPVVSAMAQDGFYGLEVNGDQLKLTGFSRPGAETVSQVEAFEGQGAGSNEILALCPTRTAVFYGLHFTRSDALKDGLKKYWWDQHLGVTDKWDMIEQTFGADMETFHGLLGGQAALAVVPREDGSTDRLAFFRCEDVQAVQAFMAKLKTDTSSEKFSGVEIVPLDAEDFPSAVFGPPFGSFGGQCAYLFWEDLLVVGNSTSALRLWRDDLARDEVWGKSVRFNRFAEKNLSSGNVTCLVNFAHALPLLAGAWEPGHKDLIDLEAFAILDMAAFQWAMEEGQAYTRLAVSLGEGRTVALPEVADAPELGEAQRYELPATVTSPVFLAKNHVDGTWEMVVQDERNRLYLLSPKGKRLWEYELDGPLVSEVLQIDRYKNRKLQLLLSTRHKVYCIDRLGRKVEHFPFSVKHDIESWNVLDYDGSKNYRILLSSPEGDLYLYNVEGKNLEGWRPFRIGGKPAVPPRHVRVGKSDYILGLTASGSLHAMERKGALGKGFPFTFGPLSDAGWVIRNTGKASTSFVGVITEAKQLLRVNFLGERQTSAVVPAAEGTLSLQLLTDQRDKRFAIARVETERFSVLGEKLNQIFEVKGTYSGKEKVQYHAFKEWELFTLWSPADGSVKLYDASGKSLLAEPLKSTQRPTLGYDEKNHAAVLYLVEGKEVVVVKLEL